MERAYTFEQMTDSALKLARLLIIETYPPEVIDGLKDIAEALITIEGFEPVFRECVEKAQVHARAWRDGYNLPAKVAA